MNKDRSWHCCFQHAYSLHIRIRAFGLASASPTNYITCSSQQVRTKSQGEAHQDSQGDNRPYLAIVDRLFLEEGKGEWPKTYLLSLYSFFSLTRSHFRRRKRLRRGEALGVEQLDQGVSSSLEGVISMDGSCRYSFLEEGESRYLLASRLCSCTFFIRLILKRFLRRVGVDELDQARPPSTTCCSGTCSAGSCRVSVILAAGIKCPFSFCSHPQAH